MSDQSSPEAKTSSTTNQSRPTAGTALLLLAVAVVAAGVSYGVAAWQNRSVTALKDEIASAQMAIRNLNASLADARGENTAGLTGLRAENADLKSRLAAAESRLAAAEARAATTAAALAKSQQRDPNAIYQAGAEVGRVAGASEDRAAATVTFDAIEGGNFDRAREFDWRDLVLMVKSYQGATTSFTGRGVQTQLTNVQAAIVRTRTAP